MEKRFDHKVTSCYKPEFPERLKEWEEDGWELVSERAADWAIEFTLKRPVQFPLE